MSVSLQDSEKCSKRKCKPCSVIRQDMRNLRQLHEAYVACDMAFKEFVSFIEHCWNNSEYSFAVLDLTSATDSGRYRCGFDEIYVKTS